MNALTQNLPVEVCSSSSSSGGGSGSGSNSSTRERQRQRTGADTAAGSSAQLTATSTVRTSAVGTGGGGQRQYGSATPPQPDDDSKVTATATTTASATVTATTAATVNGEENENVDDSDREQLNALDEKTRRYNRISMIIVYGREALCILALILTTYASIQNSPPNISKAPAPTPFFSKGSLVHDWPSGALGPTQNRVLVSELSLVFYYAPWCAESQHARATFEHVARLYYREAHFAAINCWQPGGQCHLRYSKVQSWPVLMAYLPNGLAVHYHQAWTPVALARFVQSLMRPVHRFTSPGDLMTHMTGKDAVVVAFLDVSQDSRMYTRYYQTSLSWLEKDPFQEVSFGVVTGQTSAKLFGVEALPSIRLYLWNETIQYVGNNSWTSQELSQWVNNQVQVVSMWIAPPGASKSSSLAPYFNQGPVLLFFSPRSLFGDTSDAYMMLRQLGMQYYNCPGNAWVQEMAKEYVADQRTINAAKYVALRTQCEQILRRHPSQEEEASDGGGNGRNRAGCKGPPKSTVSVSFVNVLNSSKYADGKLWTDDGADHEYCEIKPTDCSSASRGHTDCGTLGADCTMRKPNVAHLSMFGNRERDGRPVTSMLDSDQDYRGPKLLAKQMLRRECELQRLSETEGSAVFFSEPTERALPYEDLIRGACCKQNKTLTLLGMDSALYHAFAERLGVNVLDEANRTVAIIVDHAEESTYVLHNPINLYELSKFVYDYYNGTLARHMRSSNLSVKNTHSFNLGEFRKQNKRTMEERKQEFEQQRQRQQLQEQQKAEATAEAANDTVIPEERNQSQQHFLPHQYHTMREINSRNFHQVVIAANRTVVVHFYSAQCAFCSVLSQHLLTISRLLQLQPLLDFVRIDGDKNDLRWEFNMEQFPSLIIFPNQRKSESRIFSHTLQMTAPNVLGFILTNLTPAERLHANFLICAAEPQSATARNDCLLVLRRELGDSIQLSLREWRHEIRPRRRQPILRRLQLLQQSYLGTLRCLSHSCDLRELASYGKSLLPLWSVGPSNGR